MSAPRTVYIAGDHAAPRLKRFLREAFTGDAGNEAGSESSYRFVDLGPDTDGPVDYPDYAEKVGRAIQADPAALGVLICGSGIGVSMAANRMPGVRAALCHSVEYARLAREHNAANVLCLGARFLEDDEALAILRKFLGTEPSTEPRHALRVKKTDALS